MPHPRPSWPRRLRRLCLFLLLGLVTTVAVAWGLALTPSKWAETSDPREGWLFAAPDGWPACDAGWLLRRAAGKTRLSTGSFRGETRGFTVYNQIVMRTGVPWRSLQSRVAQVASERDGAVVENLPLLESGMPVPSWVPKDGIDEVRLPLLPIWPGLAFNTLFYALLWYLAFATTRLVKHNRRYRRGLCPICRYDLRADYSQGCSECGWRR